MANQPKSRGRLRKRYVKIALLTIVLLVSASYLVWRRRLGGLIEAELDAIRDAGYPVTLAELDEWYPQVPEGEDNAADVFAVAFSRYSPHWSSERIGSLLNEAAAALCNGPLPNEILDSLGQCLADNDEALRVLHRAARMPHCRWPGQLATEWRAGKYVGFPDTQAGLWYLHKLWHARSLLTIEAHAYSERGSTEVAVRSLAVTLGLGRSLVSNPLPAAQEARCMMLVYSEAVFAYLLSRARLGSEELEVLAQAYADAEQPRAWAPAAAAQQCIGSAFMKRAKEGYPVPLWHGKSFQLPYVYRASGLWDLGYLHYLRYMGKIVMRYEELDVAQSLARGYEDILWFPAPGACMLARVAVVFPPSATHVAGFSASVRRPRTVIAIERYRRAFGALPDDLEDLVPSYIEAVPVDPYDGLALRYKQLPEGYVVYSVAYNQKDEGGLDGDDRGLHVKRGQIHNCWCAGSVRGDAAHARERAREAVLSWALICLLGKVTGAGPQHIE